MFAQMCTDYGDVPAESVTSGPHWLNQFFSPLDAIALTGMIREYRPALYLEIGSGNSTKFARRAVSLYSPKTRIVSIDAEPRAEVDSICDEVIRQSLESLDSLCIFDRLQPGDFLFLDGSHRCLMNSDVTAAFLDVIPRLRIGVILHLHDIFLPWNYPPNIGPTDTTPNNIYWLAGFWQGNACKSNFPICSYAVTGNRLPF